MKFDFVTKICFMELAGLLLCVPCSMKSKAMLIRVYGAVSFSRFLSLRPSKLFLLLLALELSWVALLMDLQVD